MKSIYQKYGDGELLVADVPPPALRPGAVLVHNAASLVSAGTERMMVELAKKSLLGKARERPDLVKQVLEKISRDGLLTTVQAVRTRLDAPMPLGYSSAGTVLAVAQGVTGFQPGDRVACAGAGYANHAEVVCIPENLVVKLPAGVDFESAAFSTVGAIALQGLRLAELQLGESVAVIGLGLVGLLAAQLAKAAGCTVIGMDMNAGRCALAERLGVDATGRDAQSFQDVVASHTGSRGADKVIICAAAKGNEPVALAGEVARDRGIVVVVGAVGLDIPRKHYYEKELTFRVSRSYGPGRYDPTYEEGGQDYPIGYVRWTENRNIGAFVGQVAAGRVQVQPLITHRFALADAPRAYDLITGKTGEPSLGVVLTYPAEAPASRRLELRSGGAGGARGAAAIHTAPAGTVAVGLLGGGEFAAGTLVPAMKDVVGTELVGVCNATGIRARHVAEKFGFRYATTDEQEILGDPAVNTVVIATRHDLHARQIAAGLAAGKHVFCEKPPCVTPEELRELARAVEAVEPRDAAAAARRLLMVGFNRRYAPMAQELRAFFREIDEPLVIAYRVNAGYIPTTHWVHDSVQGGGRIIGEVCHFVDFLTFLSRSTPVSVYARALPNGGRYRDDNLVLTVEYASGSIGTVTYVANGDKAFPKERVEVFGGGAVGVLDNFRSLELTRGGKKTESKARLAQDKGHRGEWEAFARAIRGLAAELITWPEIASTMLACFGAVGSLGTGQPVPISLDDLRAAPAPAGVSKAVDAG